MRRGRLKAWAASAPYAFALTFAFAPGAGAQAQRTATPSPQPHAGAASSDDRDSDDTIVVTGQRREGSVPGDAVPQIVLGPADIRSYGASNLDELIQSLAPELGTARGRGDGGAIILLNGRRVAGFNEIRTLPTEAIARVEIFTEEVALQYGYSADQRVVNIVLRRFFRAINAEGDTGASSNGNGEHDEGELGYLLLTPRGRVNVDGKLQSQNAFTQLESGVTPPPTGPDERAERTQNPDTDSLDTTGVWNHVFNRMVAGTSSLTVQRSTSKSNIGLDPATSDLITSDSTTGSARASFTLDGSTPNWMWTANVSAQQSESNTRIDSSSSGRSDSTSTSYEAVGNITGALFSVPAGQLRLSTRSSFNEAALEGSSLRNGVTTDTDLDRSDVGLRVTLNAPLTSRNHHVLDAVGDVSANVSGSIDKLSDFDTVSTLGGGMNWSPVSDVHFSVQFDDANSAPSLNQLGAPALTTPGAPVFDPTTGQTVLVSVTSGGNPNLQSEERRDFTFNGSYAPHQISGLTLSASFVRNDTDNALTAFPLFTPALEEAFPSRFTRDASGNLVAIDRRPINLAHRESETVRVGVTFSQGFGPRIEPDRNALAGLRRGVRGRTDSNAPPPPPDGAPPPDAPPTGASAQQDAAPANGSAPQASSEGPPPSAGGGRGVGGGGFGGGRGGRGFGGRGGFGGGQAGRLNFSIFYTRRLEDAVVFVAGQPSVDLLHGAALGADGGGGPEKIEFEGGVTWRGLGVRLNGTWNSGYTILGAIPTEGLTYSDVTTVNMRAFFDFNAHPEWIRAHPLLRSLRIVARVENLFDTAPDVRDASGATPYADQPALLNPSGRTWEMGLRKLF